MVLTCEMKLMIAGVSGYTSVRYLFWEGLFDFWVRRIVSDLSLAALLCWRRPTPAQCLGWQEAAVRQHLCHV